jgi:hypothetical protein
MTVRQLRRVMPSAEFSDWIAFFEERSRRMEHAQDKAKKRADIESRRRGR